MATPQQGQNPCRGDRRVHTATLSCVSTRPPLPLVTLFFFERSHRDRPTPLQSSPTGSYHLPPAHACGVRIYVPLRVWKRSVLIRMQRVVGAPAIVHRVSLRVCYNAELPLPPLLELPILLLPPKHHSSRDVLLDNERTCGRNSNCMCARRDWFRCWRRSHHPSVTTEVGPCTATA